MTKTTALPRTDRTAQLRGPRGLVYGLALAILLNLSIVGGIIAALR